MKRLFAVIPLVFLCCLTPGCQQCERELVQPRSKPEVDVEADIQAIRDILVDLNTAANAADLDRVLSFYADNAIDIWPNEPASVGKEAIRSRSQQMFDELTVQEKDEVKDIKVSVDLAVAHLNWSSFVTLKSGGEPFEHNGNWIIVFERQSDDGWKIIYSMWSDESLIYPELPG
jgi:uncharacterized protein (TIGR02246 family)